MENNAAAIWFKRAPLKQASKVFWLYQGGVHFMDAQKQPSTQFLTLEESARVDAALLASNEKFLTRLTISSLKLLKHIANETGVAIEDLTAEQIVAWFEKDGKMRREQGIDAAYLKW
jgi:hypothetical protein